MKWSRKKVARGDLPAAALRSATKSRRYLKESGGPVLIALCPFGWPSIDRPEAGPKIQPDMTVEPGLFATGKIDWTWKAPQLNEYKVCPAPKDPVDTRASLPESPR